MGGFRRRRFVTDKQIDPTISIVVEPHARLRGMETQQACLLGDVRKRAVAVVLQERIGKTSFVVQPGSTQNKHVDEPVIVIISLNQIQPAGKPPQSRSVGQISEAAIAVIVEKTQLPVKSERG